LVRCHAYALAAELYYQREAQLVAGLRVFERDYLASLVEDADFRVELMSGEWRRFFSQATAYRRHVSPGSRRARMLVPPEELASFTDFLEQRLRTPEWAPLVVGLAELDHEARQLEPSSHGWVFIEEDDEWLRTDSRCEIVAMRPSVFNCIESDVQELLAAGELAMLARLCGDHSDAQIEFTLQTWQTLRQQAQRLAPELIDVIEGAVIRPSDYTAVRELLGLVTSEPGVLPSLDAWIRVHGDAGNYGLFFRDAARESFGG
jgi:hypothetical protein